MPKITQRKIKSEYAAKLKEIGSTCTYARRYKNVNKVTCTIKFYCIYSGISEAYAKANELFPNVVATVHGSFNSHGYESILLTFNKDDILEPGE